MAVQFILIRYSQEEIKVTIQVVSRQQQKLFEIQKGRISTFFHNRFKILSCFKILTILVTLFPFS